MHEPPSSDITRLIEAAAGGDEAAVAAIHAQLEAELRAIARRQLRQQRVGHTLQTTALVNEAWIRLSAGAHATSGGRDGFLRLAATAMRSVLVDHARRRNAEKRGGDRVRVRLQDAMACARDDAAELVAIDDALRRLEGLDRRKAQVVELRFFGGLEVEDVARLLDVSAPTVKREWRTARAWLHRELTGLEDG